MKNKLWVGGMVSSDADIKLVEECSNAFEHFDGAVWTVNYSANRDFPDYVYNILNEKKKDGLILKTNWANQHDIGMNLWLQSGKIKHGDWVCWIDHQELLKPKWLANHRNVIDKCEAQGLTAIFWGRPYYFKFNDQMRFVGNPHCWPYPLYGDAHASIVNEDAVFRDEKGTHFADFLINCKKEEDTMLFHAFKYMWTYNISNEVQNQYGKFGQTIVSDHEKQRQEFRRLANQTLEIPLTVAGITEYCQKRIGDRVFPEVFINYFEFENVFKEFFRLKILKQTVIEILANRYSWSFRKYIENGDEKQIDNNQDYISQRNRYNLLHGFPKEP